MCGVLNRRRQHDNCMQTSGDISDNIEVGKEVEVKWGKQLYSGRIAAVGKCV